MALHESDVSTCKPYIIKELLLLWSLSQRTTVLYLIKAENVFSTLYKNEKLASVFVKFKLYGKRRSRELRKNSASLTWETEQLFGSHGCFRAICLPISWLTFLLLALHETVHMTSSSSSSSWCPCKTNREFLVTIFIKNIIFGIEVGLWFVHLWELFFPSSLLTQRLPSACNSWALLVQSIWFFITSLLFSVHQTEQKKLPGDFNLSWWS